MNKITESLQFLILSQFGKSQQYQEHKNIFKVQDKTIKVFQSSNSLSAKADLLEKVLAILKRSVELASEKGTSSWLTVLPWQEHGFSLHKAAFHDAVALRYGWDPARLPQHCSCGTRFSIDLLFSCPKGGFITIRHNEIHDLTANLLTEVCYEVQVEPRLQPIFGEQFQQASLNIEDRTYLDIAMNGFLGR